MAPRELVWTHDLNGEQTGVVSHGLMKLVTDATLDDAETLTLELPADDPKVPLLIEDTQLRHRASRWVIDEVIQERQGPRTIVRAEAVALWSELGDFSHVGSVVVTNATVRSGGNQLLAGTGWTVGGSTPTTGSHYYEAQDITALAAVRAWATTTNTLVTFDTAARTVDFVPVRGVEVGLAFRRGRNIMSLTRRHRAPTITELHPFGADGLTIAGVNGGVPYLEDYSWYTARGLTLDEARVLHRKRVVWSDASILVEGDLLAAAQDRLAAGSDGSETISLSVADISSITGVAENLRPGDRVRALDPLVGDEFEATVARVQRDWLAPQRGTVELSTSPETVAAPDSSARAQSTRQWVQFSGPILGAYQVRNDGFYTAARIPLRFRLGGRAHMAVDMAFVGVGDGVATVSIYDAVADENLRLIDVPYADGEVSRASLTVALTDALGAYDFRVRVTTEATGGPDPALGVNMIADPEGLASFWIMAIGAVQESPRTETSITFDYTGTVQHWTVPDGVTEVTMSVAAGAGRTLSASGDGGSGGRITGTVNVIPGTAYDVYVGRAGQESPTPTWPNGGVGGAKPGNRAGNGGGGSWVVEAGGPLSAAVLVAGGGGGGGTGFDNGLRNGGAGGFFAGEDSTAVSGATGATQYAGGTGYENGDTGGQGEGGDGESSGSGIVNVGGGGGGGWHGGGGGGLNSGGGGGSGWADPSVSELQIEDGTVTGNGQIVIAWTIEED